MEIENALPDPPSELSRRLRLVAAREHVEDLQRFVARRVGDRERAADLTAEIFLALTDPTRLEQLDELTALDELDS